MTQRMKKLLRPRWIAVGLLVAVTAVAAALVATTTATSADAIPFSNPAHPVIDTNWIYDHNFFESNQFIYKVAGSDGCLPSATTCAPGGGTAGDSNNLPENYNGAQEFYDWWKGVGTTHTPQPNGKLGLWVTARDHLFPTRSWQLNDAELTIPGAVCAGQQVMLASHNDSTPISTNQGGPSSAAVAGSLTPMSTMHSGNWANGSGYDANMGENMNLEEIGSVLRWHEVNGTYPARTIKATLYDNEEGGLVGSGDYSAAGTPAAIVAAPTAVGDTNIKVTSTANLGAGTTIALDEVNTENPTVASVGTAATNTTLVAPSAAGDTKIYVASVGGIAVGHNLNVGLSNVDSSSVSAVGTAQRTATTLAAAASAGDTNIKVASVTNMVVGEKVAVDAGFDNVEYRVITAVGTAGSAGTGVTLDSPLSGAHANGAPVQDLGSGITLSSALSNAHPVQSRVIDTSALGTGITLTAPLTLAHAYGVDGQRVGHRPDLRQPAGPDHRRLQQRPGRAQLPDAQVGHRLLHEQPAGRPGRAVVQQHQRDPGLRGAEQHLRHRRDPAAAAQPAGRAGVPHLVGQRGHAGAAGPGRRSTTSASRSRTRCSSRTRARCRTARASTRCRPTCRAIRRSTRRCSTTAPGAPTRSRSASAGSRRWATSASTTRAPTRWSAATTTRIRRATRASRPCPASSGRTRRSDYFSNLNYWASGTVHGPGGFDKPSEGLLRGVEFIATWFSYAIASPQEGGAVSQPNRPIAYFEMTPKKPTAQTTVTFDAGYSRTKSGSTDDLTYYWDFGDGSPMVMTDNPLIQHTFPTQAAWRDVKLLVAGAGQWNDPSKFGSFRQVEPIDFFPTYYPALAPPTEPAAPTTGSAADPCGALTADEQTALIDEARDAKHAAGDDPDALGHRELGAHERRLEEDDTESP